LSDAADDGQVVARDRHDTEHLAGARDLDDHVLREVRAVRHRDRRAVVVAVAVVASNLASEVSSSQL
jgi:hypothetical protein